VEFTKSQVDKLGDRIRKSDNPSDEDMDALRAYINSASVAEQTVAGRLRQGVRPRKYHAAADHIDRVRMSSFDLGDFTESLRRREPDPLLALNPTSRVKTTDTTIEKLRRERSRLSTIQDIAGVRIVLDPASTRLDQDAVVLGLLDVYPGADIVDRRLRPSFGYRAVHVVIQCESRFVEIQVRTHHQDDWAQLFERLADQWGRQMRYGEPPDEPDACPIDGDGATRQEIVDSLIELSDVLATFDSLAADSEAWATATRSLADNATPEGLALLRRAVELAGESRGRYDAAADGVAVALTHLRRRLTDT
jgi:hypothetical protein